MEPLGEDFGSSGGRSILCCQCGTAIPPNPANMCVACIRTQVDITEGIPKQGTLFFCRNCERYLQPPVQWVSAALESRELLAVCLKKMKGLKSVRLVDAGFVWTEPHSKRIKVKLTIQKEVLNGTVLQQVFIVEFTVQNQMCDDCHRTEAKNFWKSVVQVRQKAKHKKTMYYLEQAILKHRAHVATLNIKEVPGGIDFYYAQPQDSRKFVEFVQAVVPCKYGMSKKLVSHDIRSNIHNYKTTFMVDVAPICKDDIICLPKKTSATLAHIGQIVVCERVTTSIHLINPYTLQLAEVTGEQYWRNPFESIATSRNLQEFVVMEVDRVNEMNISRNSSVGAVSHKHELADVYLLRANDMASDQIHTKTHIGGELRPGDTVLGFDLKNSNVNNYELDKMNEDYLPDVVVIKKHYANKAARRRARKWRLRRLEREAAASNISQEVDYTDFLEDLEEDKILRENVNVYKDKRTKVDIPVEVDPEIPTISLEEMMEDLDLGKEDKGAVARDAGAVAAGVEEAMME